MQQTHVQGNELLMAPQQLVVPASELGNMPVQEDDALIPTTMTGLGVTVSASEMAHMRAAQGRPLDQRTELGPDSPTAPDAETEAGVELLPREAHTAVIAEEHFRRAHRIGPIIGTAAVVQSIR